MMTMIKEKTAGYGTPNNDPSCVDLVILGDKLEIIGKIQWNTWPFSKSLLPFPVCVLYYVAGNDLISPNLGDTASRLNSMWHLVLFGLVLFKFLAFIANLFHLPYVTLKMS
jgi:hypothetical protein